MILYNDNLLARQVKDLVQKSLIIIPDQIKSNYKLWEAIGISDKITTVKIGDRFYTSADAGIELNLNESIIKEHEIRAVFSPHPLTN